MSKYLGFFRDIEKYFPKIRKAFLTPFRGQILFSKPRFLAWNFRFEPYLTLIIFYLHFFTKIFIDRACDFDLEFL